MHDVAYQHDKADQFYQHYDYDADNRIYEVQTSRDGWIWEKEARYFYYRHGPLARVETGDLIVQGTDYAYTIQGWLKGVNAGALIADRDMGKDGYDDASNSRKYIAQDAYGFILDYFESDYTRINSGGAYKFIPNYTATNYNGVANNLYNGNIMSMSTALLQPLTDTDADGHHDKSNVLGKIYAYDQLNRIASSNSYEKAMTSTSNFTWADTEVPLDETYVSQNWNTTYTYDGNGNILSMQRAGNQNTAYDMDQLTYHYRNNTNKLIYVDDAITDDETYDVDVDDQAPYNYSYDSIGNLTADVAEGIEKITWNVYGKIKKIVKEDESGLVFAYDATGNRISKTVIPVTGDVTTTYYVRDAQGNVMAVYTHTASDTAKFELTEQHIYGSSRIGMVQTNIDMLVTFTEDNYFYRSLGEKRYELSNHLGNVLSVISDRRLAFDTDANGTTNYYEADVMSAQDYDPFGMLLVGRSWEVGSEYRYGFNGQEIEENSIYDFGNRIVDSRLGIFLSPDPISPKTPSKSPYHFAGNSPIQSIDRNGLKEYHYQRVMDSNTGKPVLILIDVKTIYKTVIVGYVDNPKSVWGRYPIYAEVEDTDDTYVVHQTGTWTLQYKMTNTFVRGDESVTYDTKVEAENSKDEDFNWTSKDASMAFQQAGLNVREEMTTQGGAGGMFYRGTRGYTVAPKKFDYFFGRVILGSEHNVLRSAQNLKDLTTLGIKTESQLMTVFDEAFNLNKGVIKTTEYGTTVTKTVQVGSKGAIDVSFFYKAGETGSTPTVSSIIPKIAN